MVNQSKKISWKSYKHENGELCFGGGWFIVGIDTPLGSYTYHYENKYWDLFKCKELETAKHWDGHTEKDVTRLLSLPSAQPERPEQDILAWLLAYHMKSFDLKGRYMAHEVIGWLVHDFATAYMAER